MKDFEILFERANELESVGDYAAAETFAREAIDLKQAALGKEHQDLANDYFNLGLLLYAQDKYEPAEDMLQRSLHIEEMHAGPDEEGVLPTLEYLAEVQFNRGFYAESEKTYRRYLDLHARKRSYQDVEMVSNLHNLAEICDLRGKLSEANEIRVKAQRLLADQISVLCRRKAS